MVKNNFPVFNPVIYFALFPTCTPNITISWHCADNQLKWENYIKYFSKANIQVSQTKRVIFLYSIATDVIRQLKSFANTLHVENS